MESYPSNSKTKVQTEGAPRAEPKTEKKIERVVTGEVVRRKKPLGRRFGEVFGGGDAQGVATYVVQDVLLPAAKDMIADAVSQGIEKMLFGEARVGRSSRSPLNRKNGNGYVSYNKIVGGGSTIRREEPRAISQRSRANHSFDEIILDSRAEAQGVLDQLFTLIDDYEVATVADLYEMVGQTGSFTDERWGWFDMRGAQVRRVKGGYLLDLPKTEHLE